jgi:hypothetical protein
MQNTALSPLGLSADRTLNVVKPDNSRQGPCEKLPIKQTSSAWYGVCEALIGHQASGAHRSIAYEASIPMSAARGAVLSRSRPRRSTSFGSLWPDKGVFV